MICCRRKISSWGSSKEPSSAALSKKISPAKNGLNKMVPYGISNDISPRWVSSSSFFFFSRAILVFLMTSAFFSFKKLVFSFVLVTADVPELDVFLTLKDFFVEVLLPLDLLTTLD